MEDPGAPTAATPSPTPAPRPRGFFSGPRKVYIAVALLLLAIGYFGFTAFQKSTVYYYTVAQLVSADTKPNETVRVAGTLVKDSFQRDSQDALARFKLTDGNGVVDADYTGILPELFFNDNSQIVLEGKYDKSGVFHTSNVVVKCPSKYQAATPSGNAA